MRLNTVCASPYDVCYITDDREALGAPPGLEIHKEDK